MNPPGSSLPARTPADTMRLRVAHGSVRDTLGAIRNLEQLLKSVRVHPKDIAEIVPVSLEALPPMEAAIREVLSGIARQAPAAVTELDKLVWPRFTELRTTLATASGSKINARIRLQLEDVVSRSVQELDAARVLWELLEEACGAPRTEVDVAEALRTTLRKPKREEPVAPMLVGLVVDEAVELLASARFLGLLVTAAVAQLGSRAASAGLVVRVGAVPNGLVLAPGESAPESIAVQPIHQVRATIPCVDAATRLMAATVSRETDRLTIVWAR